MSYEKGYNRVMQAAGMEKEAYWGQALKGMGQSAWQGLKNFGGSVKSMLSLPGEMGRFGKSMGTATDARKAIQGTGNRVGGGGGQPMKDVEFAEDWAKKNLQNTFDEAKPAIGVTATGGAAYGLGSSGNENQ